MVDLRQRLSLPLARIIGIVRFTLRRPIMTSVAEAAVVGKNEPRRGDVRKFVSGR